MDKITLKVEGMSCGHCKAAVEKALKGTAGVRDAQVDLAAKSVTVTYDAGIVGREVMAKVVKEAGYEVVG
jgi:copper chaperone